jgi:hypothetical protein
VGRRPGHPRYRTLRHHRSFSDRQSTASAVASEGRDHGASKTPNWSPWPCCKRCSDSPQRRDGCATRTADCAGCSLSAHTIGLQQAPPRGDRNAARGHRASGCVHLPVHRRRVGDRGRPPNAPTWPGGPSTVSASHSRFFWGLRLHLVRPVGAAGGIRADRRQGRRARHSARDARRRPQPARDASRSDVDGRQELLRQEFEAALADAWAHRGRPVLEHTASLALVPRLSVRRTPPGSDGTPITTESDEAHQSLRQLRLG